MILSDVMNAGSYTRISNSHLNSQSKGSMSVVMQSYDKHFQAHLALLTYLQQPVDWQNVNKPCKCVPVAQW